MIIKDIKIFSQNVHKNNLIVNTILETKFSFNIFIQEPSWTTIHSILSSRCSEGEKLVGAPNYPNWLTFSRNLMTFQELLLMSISDCLLSGFYFVKTFLVTETFHLFCSSTIMTFSIWWTFIVILLNQLWSISRILKLILEIICRTLFTLTIYLIVMISSLLQTLLI